MKSVILFLSFITFSIFLRAQQYHALQGGNFQQNWNDTNLITVNHNWSNVPSVMGFRGDNLTLTTGVDPQTVLADQTTVNVIANQTSPDFLSSGGVAEFHLPDPSVALQGSGTADAPFIVLYLNSTGISGIRVKYKLRDLDGSANNAVQAVALQYRLGTSGNFTNLPAAFVADATTGPSQASLVTNVNVLLPPECNNRTQLQLRIITANANGSDEWVGIDDIEVLAESQIPLPVRLTAFSGARDGSLVWLHWATASEERNTGFGIEASGNGTDFRQVGFISSQAVNGNSDQPLYYQFEMKDAAGFSYFRLRQADADGRAVFSQVIRLDEQPAGSFRVIDVFPVPVADRLHVRLYAAKQSRITCRITGLSGQWMTTIYLQLNSGINDELLDTGKFMKGLNLLELTDGSGGKPILIRVWKE